MSREVRKAANDETRHRAQVAAAPRYGLGGGPEGIRQWASGRPSRSVGKVSSVQSSIGPVLESGVGARLSLLVLSQALLAGGAFRTLRKEGP